MFYTLKTIRKGTPSISFTPFCEPIPMLTDREIISFPTMLNILRETKELTGKSYLIVVTGLNGFGYAGYKTNSEGISKDVLFLNIYSSEPDTKVN